MQTGKRPGDEQGGEFDALARRKRLGLLREYLGFMRQTGKWWLLPIFALLGGIGVLIVLGGGSAAPFLYALF